jgi:hypothetical protein
MKHSLYSSCTPFRQECIFDPGGPSLTRQEFADECDINVLMAKYEKHGVLPLAGSEPRYVDCASIPSDFRVVIDMMRDAEASFMSLHARVRAEFDNDARAFVDFAADPANIERLREWGLAPRPEAPAPPLRVEVVPNAAVPVARPGPAGGPVTVAT